MQAYDYVAGLCETGLSDAVQIVSLIFRISHFQRVERCLSPYNVIVSCRKNSAGANVYYFIIIDNT